MAATLPPVGAWPPPNGGNGVIRGVTRRRHAASHLLTLQNPHRHRCGRYCEADEIGGDYLAWPRRGVAGDERPEIRDMDGAERTQDSPNKNRAGPLRYKTRPADPFSPDLRYKTLPARSKSPYLARFARAGRTLYRCHQQEAVRGELCTACEAETALAITAHHGPRAWRARRTWLRCPWVVAGPGRAIYSDPAPLVWRAPEGLEGLAAVPVGGGGAWPGFETTRRATDQRPGTTGVEGAGGSGGHGRASRSTTPSEARVWRSRGRPGPTAPGTPVGLQATPRGADGSRAGRRRRAHRAARSRGRDLRRLEHPWGHKQPGSTQQRARSAAAPRAPRVCQWLTG